MDGYPSVVVLTALEEEAAALVAELESSEQITEAWGRATVGIAGGRRVLVHCAQAMGSMASGVAAARAIDRWRPDYLLLTGITGGIKNSGPKFGDVVVASQVVYYEPGKLQESGREWRWEVFRPDREVLVAATEAQSHEWWNQAKALPPDRRRRKPAVHVGILACGEKVIATKSWAEEFRVHWPKVIAVEMEAAGVAHAAYSAPQRPKFGVIKAICDWADADKTDDWHTYASRVAARFTAELIGCLPSAASQHDQPYDGSAEGVLSDGSESRPRLPVAITRLVGRDEDLQELDSTLKVGTRLITLQGAGGIGKTRLAAALASQALPAYAAAWWVDLSSTRVEEDVVNEVARQLGVVLERGQNPLDAVSNHLDRGRVLLFLDNCEHLVSNVASLCRRLLERQPLLSVVTTSRERLGLTGERVVPVSPLRLPAAQDSFDQTARAPAVQLFLERAQDHDPGLNPSPEEFNIAVDICRKLEGVPLALELAAGWIPVLSLKQILDGLDDQLGLLVGSDPTASPRHRTMAACIEWSYDLLSAREQRLLRTLGLFENGADLQAIEGISDSAELGEPLRLVRQLQDKSLVRVSVEGGHTRVRMLDTLREFARRRLLVNRSEFAERRVAFITYMTRLAVSTEPLVRGREQALWLDLLEMEHANLLATINMAIEMRDSTSAFKTAGSLWRFWRVRGYLDKGGAILEQLFARFPDATPERVRALCGAGNLAYWAGELDNAEALLRDAHSMAEVFEGKWAISFARTILGIVLMEKGEEERLAEAKSLLVRSVPYWEDAHDSTGLYLASVWLSRLARHARDLASAHALEERCLTLSSSLDDTWAVARYSQDLGSFAQEDGRLEQAELLYRDSERLHRELHDEVGLARALAGIGSLLVQRLNSGNQADPALRVEAGRTLRESVRLWLRLASPVGAALAVESVALLADAAGLADEAVFLGRGVAVVRGAYNATGGGLVQQRLEQRLAGSFERVGMRRAFILGLDAQKVNREGILLRALDALERIT